MTNDTRSDKRKAFDEALEQMRRKAFKTGQVSGIAAAILACSAMAVTLTVVTAAPTVALSTLIGVGALTGFLGAVGAVFIAGITGAFDELPAYKASKLPPLGTFAKGFLQMFMRMPPGWPLGAAVLAGMGVRKMARGLSWFGRKAAAAGDVSNLRLLIGLPPSEEQAAPKPAKKLAMPSIEAKPEAANISITIERPAPKHATVKDARHG